jgi:hypothetical protein
MRLLARVATTIALTAGLARAQAPTAADTRADRLKAELATAIDGRAKLAQRYLGACRLCG